MLPGNLLGQSNCTTYEYNAENQLVTTAGVTYTYDGDGKRVKKDQTSGSTYDRLYWYDLGLDPLFESDLSGNLTEEYVFFGGLRIARRNVSSGNIYYYFADHLASTRTIVQAGQTSACYDADFYPYGGERAYTNTCPQRYKFTGKEREEESNLDYFVARHYPSWMGRFLQPDEPFADQHVGDPQSWNLYSYVRNNPLNFIDPTGRDRWKVVCRTIHHTGSEGHHDSDASYPDWDEERCTWEYVIETTSTGPMPTPEEEKRAQHMAMAVAENQAWLLNKLLGLLAQSVRTQPRQKETTDKKESWPSYGTNSCGVYKSSGSPILAALCKGFGNSPTANSIRGCLQQYYNPTYYAGQGGYESRPGPYSPGISKSHSTATALLTPDLLFASVGPKAHAVCVTQGLLNH